MPVVVHFNEEHMRLELMMRNSLGTLSPLRDEHGRVIDFLPEHRHAGGAFTGPSLHEFASRFDRVDEAFDKMNRGN